MVHYQYYPWQITPCAVLWDIPSGRIYSCVLLSCSRTLFHLMAVPRCLDVSLYIVMRFQIQGAEDLSTRSAACMVWNKLSNRHRGLGRSFLQRIRKPLTVLEQASGAHTKPWPKGPVQGCFLHADVGALGPLRAVRREDSAHTWCCGHCEHRAERDG